MEELALKKCYLLSKLLIINLLKSISHPIVQSGDDTATLQQDFVVYIWTKTSE